MRSRAAWRLKALTPSSGRGRTVREQPGSRMGPHPPRQRSSDALSSGEAGRAAAWRDVSGSAARTCRRERIMGATRTFDRITFEPGEMGGRACIRGLRITAGLVVSLVAEGATVEEILADYPYLEAEDIRQAVSYAAWLTREEVMPA